MLNVSLEETLNIDDAKLLASPITLPCGRTVPNRFAKVAMYENLAPFWGGPPNELHKSLYSRWARGGWGVIITGNFQISASHLTIGRDVVIPKGKINESQLNSFRELAVAMHSSNNTTSPLALMQISHSGRQSPFVIGGRVVSPPVSCSSHRVGASSQGTLTKISNRLMFHTPRTLSTTEVEEIAEDFSNAAQLALKSGFDGVQFHAAHGYLLSTFLSKKLNDRTDAYRDRLLLLRHIVTRVRSSTPSDFVIGIKLNVADYLHGGLTEEQALEDCKQISLMGIDFIEVSGGNYEDPAFTASPRQVFFASYSRQVVRAISTLNLRKPPLVLLTGGLRTPTQFNEVLLQNTAQILGLGRLAIVCTDLPNRIFSSTFQDGIYRMKPIPEPVLYQPKWIPKLVGAGVDTAWYNCQLKLLADGKDVDMDIGSAGAVINLFIGGPYELSPPAAKLLLYLPLTLTFYYILRSFI